MDSNIIAQKLNVTLQKIKQVDSQDKLSAMCEEFLGDISIDYFEFSLCHSISLADPDILVMDNLPREWSDFYHKRDFQRVDPITSYCFSNTLPVHWHKLIQLPEYRDSQYQVMLRNARKFGLVSGLSIPLRTSSGGAGMFSLISRQEPEQCEHFFNILTPYALLLTSHLLDCIKRNRWMNKEKILAKIKLTDREYHCLFWACEGKTSWEISRILCISERTVLFHLNNATQKVGAKNRQHAVAKSLLGNVIRPNFYHDNIPYSHDIKTR